MCACLPTLRPLIRTAITEPISKFNEKRHRKRQCPSTGGATSPVSSSQARTCSCKSTPSGDSIYTITTRITASSSTTLEKTAPYQCQCQQVPDIEKEATRPPLKAQDVSTNRRSRYILEYLRVHSPLRWPLPLTTAPIPPSSMV